MLYLIYLSLYLTYVFSKPVQNHLIKTLTVNERDISSSFEATMKQSKAQAIEKELVIEEICTGEPVYTTSWKYTVSVKMPFDKPYFFDCVNISGPHIVHSGGVGKNYIVAECLKEEELKECKMQLFANRNENIQNSGIFICIFLILKWFLD